jgi:hypothetical protein
MSLVFIGLISFFGSIAASNMQKTNEATKKQKIEIEQLKRDIAATKKEEVKK